MHKEEFTDRLFDTINESSYLPIQDIVTDAFENTIKIYLTDGTLYELNCGRCGYWCVLY